MMRPESEAELAEAIAGATGPLAIRGGGTRPVGHPGAGEVLETGGLSGITLYEPGALTLVAQAGTPLAEIEAALEAEKQMLAFEPMDHRPLLRTEGEPTIGGVVAGNVSGPRRVSTVGACRDSLLGVRLVDGTGTVVKNGGRVMKNVTGYDLTKLMCGARGTLGVLSEVSLKVLPKPEAAATLTLSGLDVAGAVDVMARALTSPYEVTGAAFASDGPFGVPSVWLRVEGFEGSVAYRAGRLQEMFPEIESQIDLRAERSAKTWAWIRDAQPLAEAKGDVWRICCVPSAAPGLVARLEPEALLLDWGGGLIWAALPEDTDARARLGAFDGHATLVRGAAGSDVPVFQPEPAPVAALSAGLRARFDPRGILNAGLMG